MHLKILHYSDKKDEKMKELYQRCDIFLTTGDFDLFDFFGMGDWENKKPAFGVYGNHCSGNYFDEIGVQNIHNKIIEWNGLKIGGWQSCIRYKKQGIAFEENEAEVFAENFPQVDILLLHVGPFGLLDDPHDDIHTGSKAIRKYVEEKPPKFIFCGHQYSDDFLNFNDTKIYRTYGAKIIEIEI